VHKENGQRLLLRQRHRKLTGYALSRKKLSLYANGFLRPVADKPQRRHFTTEEGQIKG
jgi:hypothetical protein